MNSEEEILDYRRKSKRRFGAFPLYVVAFFSFIYWFASDFVELPLGKEALILGMILLLVAAVWRFAVVRPKSLTDFAYLAGRLTLIAGVYLHVSGWPRAGHFLWASFLCFAVGLAYLYFKRFRQR